MNNGKFCPKHRQPVTATVSDVPDKQGLGPFFF